VKSVEGGCWTPTLKTTYFCAGGCFASRVCNNNTLCTLKYPDIVIIIIISFSILNECKLSYCNLLPLILSSDVM
jgi:hypothetical protein